MAVNQTIIYSNSLTFEGRILAFRQKELFDITSTPVWIPFNYNANCWIINRKQLTKQEPITIDLNHLQWYSFIELDACFNLEKHDNRTTKTKAKS